MAVAVNHLPAARIIETGSWRISDGEVLQVTHQIELVVKPVPAVRYTMLVVGSIFGVLAVFAALRPGGLWPIAVLIVIGLFVWLYVETLCIVLTSKVLICRRFGITRWRIERSDVEFVEGHAGAYGGFPALLVYSLTRKKQIGSISRMQFRQKDLAELQLRLDATRK